MSPHCTESPNNSEAELYSLKQPLTVDWEEVTLAALPCLVLKTEAEDLVVERVREEREKQVTKAIYQELALLVIIP